MIEWTTILVAVISALGAGGITSLVTMREKKKEKQLENKEKEEEVKDKNDSRWERLADQLEEQIGKLNEQITELNTRLDKKDELIQEKEDQLSVTREKLDSVRTKCALATIMRCESMSCKDRVPPVSMALTKGLGNALQDYVEDLTED